MDYSAIVVAAGSGSRTGLDFNKILYPLAQGRIIDSSLEPFIQDPDCRQIVLVISKQDEQALSDLKDHEKIEIVFGGDSRMESVWNGLQAADQPWVFIHDGARPFLQPVLLERLKEALKDRPAAALAIPVRDSLRKKSPQGLEIVDRSNLYAMQTPQAFKREDLKKAYLHAFEKGIEATDDVQVAALDGIQTELVKSTLFNLKVTEPEDLVLLEGLKQALWNK